jgi:streptogramin lyase
LEVSGHAWAPSRWAVIKDARRRQRRRQRRIFTVAAALLVAAAIGWTSARNSPPGHELASPSPAAGTVAQIDPGGIIESTTALRGHLWVLTCRHHCSQPLSTAVRGQLVELTAAGRPIKRFPVADPGAVASGDGSIWLAHFYAGQVTRIDPHTGHATAAIRLTLPGHIGNTAGRRFIPSAISFSSDRVWVSTALGWTAEINPRTARLIRMAFSSSEAPSAATAAGLTWVADELDGIGTFPATTTHVTPHQITWDGQPVDITTVVHGAGLIWALGSETNYTISLIHPPTSSVVTAINPHTRRIVHQWRVGDTATMVVTDGGAYVGDDPEGRLLHLIPPNRAQVRHGPRAARLIAATPHALWAATPTRLLRIELPQR